MLPWTFWGGQVCPFHASFIFRGMCSLELSKTFKLAVNVSFFAAKDQTFISIHIDFTFRFYSIVSDIKFKIISSFMHKLTQPERKSVSYWLILFLFFPVVMPSLLCDLAAAIFTVWIDYSPSLRTDPSLYENRIIIQNFLLWKNDGVWFGTFMWIFVAAFGWFSA